MLKQHSKGRAQLTTNVTRILIYRSLCQYIGRYCRLTPPTVVVLLYSHVSQSIISLQHGFMRSRSCSSQLLSVLHSIGEALDKNKQTIVLYLDFAKAFDTVDHAALIEKLKWYGVTGQLLDWFSDYLMDRSQRVVIDDQASLRLPVTSVVQ